MTSRGAAGSSSDADCWALFINTVIAYPCRRSIEAFVLIPFAWATLMPGDECYLGRYNFLLKDGNWRWGMEG